MGSVWSYIRINEVAYIFMGKIWDDMIRFISLSTLAEDVFFGRILIDDMNGKELLRFEMYEIYGGM
jgi:hypothetical protein